MEKQTYKNNSVELYCGDALDYYDLIPQPISIISDGPYGINGYKGDLSNYKGLDSWYEPHIKKWSERASTETTLWFWNTEIGWATVHPVLSKYGWKYRTCHIWNKGIGHIAGNVNSKSIRKLPVVTEVCVQYVREPEFEVDGRKVSLKEWLKYEWGRTKLPFKKTNEACGVKDAATRKYFTQSDLWYFPPVDAFVKIQEYANTHGKLDSRPFFSIDGVNPVSAEQWRRLRPKFNYIHGLTNVWNEPSVNGKERLRKGQKSLHLNQKPLKLIDSIISMTSDVGDVIWEPFGGLCTAAVSSIHLERNCYSCEINKEIFLQASERIKNDLSILKLNL